ncbi:Uu.00g012110.m01.CDS01 [Anthostomella pinea]|uniref:Uu.00g012110.m01.CDS01 n=1 Tax=Anthostomella pinea TaxID=933095 RepID=A0AAI8VXY2_9PEZI|nr:Uu.00g012110.m01.CDS01 [Anthostomella pinea]
MAGNTSQIPADVKERIKSSYDAIATEYNEWTVPHSAQRMQYLATVLEKLPLSDPSLQPKILELGCGCGLPVTKKLMSYPAATVIANDLSSAQIAIARKNLLDGPDDENAKRLTLIEGDMFSLAFPDDSLDLVLGFYSIIHLPRVEQTALLEKIARWLKPDGYLLANFSTVAADASINKAWIEDKGWMFWSGWGVDGTLEAIKTAGLEVVSSEVAKDTVDDSSFLWVIAKR